MVSSETEHFIAHGFQGTGGKLSQASSVRCQWCLSTLLGGPVISDITH